MDTVSYMILTFVMSTTIDQKIIEFEHLGFELCPFFAKVPKNFPMVVYTMNR